MTLAVDRKHPAALEANAGRQLLRATRELFRLALGEDALNGHIGLDAANPQTQDKITALLKQLQFMLDVWSFTIGQPEKVRQEIDSTHGASSYENAIVKQPDGSAP